MKIKYTFDKNEAQDILTQFMIEKQQPPFSELDTMHVAVEIADESPRPGYPKTFSMDMDIPMSIFKHMKAREQVSAIKELRSLTGCSLKEGKDYTDNIRNAMNW